MDLCAGTHNPLDCSPGLTSPLCGVGCTDCSNCTQCTACTGCTGCTGCTNCSNCSAQCTNQCTGHCTGGCSNACTNDCSAYCTHACTNPSAGQVPPPPNCGFTQFPRGAVDTNDPVVLGELKVQLRRQLALVEAAELQIGQTMLPQTVAEVEMLERKMMEAMETLRARKIELEARRQSSTPQSEPANPSTHNKKKDKS